MKKSKVITFIGGFYIFGGIISFLSLLLGGSPLNTVFDLPDIPDYVVKFLLAIFGEARKRAAFSIGLFSKGRRPTVVRFRLR